MAARGGELADELTIGAHTLRLTVGDIADMEIDAFVYYARHDLVLGSGIGTAISVRGGPTIQEELEKLAPIKTTEAVVTAAGGMKAGRIIHAVGPRFQEEDLEAKLEMTVLNCLKKADESGIRTVAFPAMGAGFYGVPLDVSARVMFSTIRDYLAGTTGIGDVIICLGDNREHEVFRRRMSELNQATGVTG
ncbi:MAG: macro domain-containing protein [Candidatus Zixiibacteriota bacterium]